MRSHQYGTVARFLGWGCLPKLNAANPETICLFHLGNAINSYPDQPSITNFANHISAKGVGDCLRTRSIKVFWPQKRDDCMQLGI